MHHWESLLTIAAISARYAASSTSVFLAGRGFAGSANGILDALYQLCLIDRSRFDHRMGTARALASDGETVSIRESPVEVFHAHDGRRDAFELKRIGVVTHSSEEGSEVALRNSHAALEAFLCVLQTGPHGGLVVDETLGAEPLYAQA